MSGKTQGDLIAETLSSQGRKQKWLAAQIGVTESFMSKVIAGHRRLQPQAAARVAEVLGLPLFLLSDFHGAEESFSVSETGVAA